MTTLESLQRQYFEFLRTDKKLSVSTQESYERDLKQAFAYFAELGLINVEQVRTFDLERYLNAMAQKGKSPSTISRTSATLRSFFGYIYEVRLIADNPAKRLKGPRITQQPAKLLTAEQIQLLLEMPDVTQAIGQRDQVIFELLYGTGLKVSEMIHLKLSDLNLNMDYIRVTSKYGGRVIPISSYIKSAIGLYLEDGRKALIKSEASEDLLVNFSGEQLTRQGFWKIVKGYAKKLGLEQEITPEAIRQTFAMHLLERGTEVSEVQQLLGHQGLNSTKAYTSVKQDRLQAFAGKTRPRD